MDRLFIQVSLHRSTFSNSSPEDENVSLSLNGIYDSSESHLTTSIILTSMMSTMCGVTLLGNTLVILAFIVDKRLRNHNCYCLLNLAVCDFFVGFCSIPWWTYFAVSGRWSLGKAFCKFLLTVDSTICISSVFSIVIISYDRFISVTKAVSNRILQGTSEMTEKTTTQIGTAWLVAFLLSAPPIIFWDFVTGKSSVPEGVCTYEFDDVWYVFIVVELMDFYIPFILIVYFNFNVYWSIRKRNKDKLSMLKTKATAVFSLHGNIERNVNVAPTSQKPVKLKVHSKKSPNRVSLFGKRTTLPGSSSQIIHVPFQLQYTDFHLKIAHHSKLRKDKKIAKSLAIVVGIYCCCWFPYILITLIRAVCQGGCVQPYMVDISMCCLWLNSSINPFIYPLCHKKFLKAFKKVLSLTLKFARIQ